MLEYDFLRGIGDLVRSLREFPLPAMITDMAFQVYWSNAPMHSYFSNLGTTAGLSDALAEFERDRLLDDLRENGGCILQDVLPMSGVGMNLSPLWKENEMIGVLIVLMGAEATMDFRDLHQAAHTAVSLSEGIRRSMGDLFDIMDTAAHKAEVLDAGWIKPNFERIALLGYRMLRTADNITEYAGYQNGTLDLRHEAVDLLALLRELEGTLGALEPLGEIPVRFVVDEGAAVARVDPAKFELILFNLLHNALYFTRPGNEVAVEGRREDQMVVITVRDRGMGIPADFLPHVFKPYTTHNPSGHQPTIGLGLTLARILTAAQEGTLELTSTEGEGTTVTLRFPERSFTRPVTLGQGPGVGHLRDRFSRIYVGLSDVVISPYRERL